MMWFGLGLMLVALLVESAQAEVAVATGVPFTALELSVALAVRGAKVSDITVRAVSRTVVELRTSVGNHRVDLGTAGIGVLWSAP